MQRNPHTNKERLNTTPRGQIMRSNYFLTIRWRYSASFPSDFEFVLHGLLERPGAIGLVKMDGSCQNRGTVKVLLTSRKELTETHA